MLHFFSKSTLGIGVLIFLFSISTCSSAQELTRQSQGQHADQNGFLNRLSLNGPERKICLNSVGSRIEAPVQGEREAGTSLREKYAGMLDVLPQTIYNLELYRFIDEWYGVRYQMGGSSKEGIDCSAFIQKLYEHVFGINLLRTALMQVAETRLIKDAAKCQEGDLIFFKSGKGRISHVGLYLKNDFFVHASSSQGIIISSLDDAYWGRRFACAGRVL